MTSAVIDSAPGSTNPATPSADEPKQPKLLPPWRGYTFAAWIRLLMRNRFAVDRSHWPLALRLTLATGFQSTCKLIQELSLGGKLNRVKIEKPPIFIIGHWRTGTTMLHEIMSLDDRHTSPTTFQVAQPHHFVLTERLLSYLLKRKETIYRPMDKMVLRWDTPQEDEFALSLLEQPSIYTRIAFPNRPAGPDGMDLEALGPKVREQWKKALLGFLRRVTYKDPRRLVLKSPPHTCRIAALHELFPDALFIHIVRNPYIVYPSTMNLWKSLYEEYGLQRPNCTGMHDSVMRTFNFVYDRLEQGKQRLLPQQFWELRYEDLVRDPVGQLRQIYEHFQLGAFEAFQPRLENYLKEKACYQTNRYRPLDPAVRDEITRNWGEVIRRYGYEEATA